MLSKFNQEKKLQHKFNEGVKESVLKIKPNETVSKRNETN